MRVDLAPDCLVSGAQKGQKGEQQEQLQGEAAQLAKSPRHHGLPEHTFGTRKTSQAERCAPDPRRGVQRGRNAPSDIASP